MYLMRGISNALDSANQTQIAESALDSADLQNLIKNNLARSANLLKSFCYFLLLQKVESPLSFNYNLPNKVGSQNLSENQVKKSLSKFLLLFAFAKSRVPPNFTDSNLSNKVDSQNLVKNNSVRSTQNSPASWCKKSESKGAEVPPADFLLEAEKRGSPPKSEKRQLLGNSFKNSWGERQGGAALLREESSEIDGKGGAESAQESQGGWLLRDARKSFGLPRSHSLARNDENLDSSLRLRSAQNDKVGIYDYNFGVRVAESGKKYFRAIRALKG